MMSLLMKLCFRNKGYFSETAAKKRYASLSSVVGIILNPVLCIAKIVIGFSSHTVAFTDGLQPVRRRNVLNNTFGIPYSEIWQRKDTSFWAWEI